MGNISASKIEAVIAGISKEHPRIYFTGDLLNQLREKKDELPFKKPYGEIKSKADELLTSEMPRIVRLSLAVLVYSVTGVMALVFIWYGYQFSILGLSRFSYSTGLPMVSLYAAMPISGCLTVFYLIEKFGDLWDEEGLT